MVLQINYNNYFNIIFIINKRPEEGQKGVELTVYEVTITQKYKNKF